MKIFHLNALIVGNFSLRMNAFAVGYYPDYRLWPDFIDSQRIRVELRWVEKGSTAMKLSRNSRV